MAGVRQPGKVAGSGGGEHLGNGPLIGLGDAGIRVEEVAAHILPFPGPGPLRPLVVLGGVVHHKVHADVHALLMALAGEMGQILDGAQILPHLAEIGYGIAAVGLALGHVQERHQVDGVDAALLEVVQLPLHAPEIPGKIIDVEHHAHHILLFEPGGIRLFFQVPLLQRGAPLLVKPLHLGAELVKHI